MNAVIMGKFYYVAAQDGLDVALKYIIEIKNITEKIAPPPEKIQTN